MQRGDDRRVGAPAHREAEKIEMRSEIDTTDMSAYSSKMGCNSGRSKRPCNVVTTGAWARRLIGKLRKSRCEWIMSYWPEAAPSASSCIRIKGASRLIRLVSLKRSARGQHVLSWAAVL